jgi:hypothetical protein
MNVRIYRFKLDIKGKLSKVNGQTVYANRFKKNKSQYIIYVIRNGKEIIYVGESERGVFRCVQGFTLNVSQSQAYRWRKDSDVKNRLIEIIVVNGFQPYGLLRKKYRREAVEADVATQLYYITGSWPRKLSAIKIHGTFHRMSNHRNAVKAVIRSLKNQKWI